MRWKDTLQEAADRASAAAASARHSASETAVGAAQEPTQDTAGGTDDEGGWLPDFFGDQGIGPDAWLLKLVRLVRDDERTAGSSTRDARKTALRRQRKLSWAAKLAGPLAGPARQFLQLYGDTATVTDLVGVRGLDKTDAEIAAVMLVLWGVTSDIGVAQSAMASGAEVTVVKLVNRKLKDGALDVLPPYAGPIAITKALFALRRGVTDLTIGGTARGAGGHVRDISRRALILLGDGSGDESG